MQSRAAVKRNMRNGFIKAKVLNLKMPSKISLFTFLLLATLAGNAQSVNTIFSRYLQFLGGEQRLKTIHSRIDSGTYNYGGIEFPFVSYAQAPDHYKYIVTFKGKYFAQAFDGKDGWKIDVFKNEKTKTILHGKAATAMANEADVHLESPFLHYKQKGSTATLTTPDTVDNKPCYRIQFITSGADTALYSFDPQTGALLKKVATAKNTELNDATLETFYTNYTEQAGLKFPLKITSKIKDQTVLTITIKNVILNPTIDDNLFKP
jgi:hypothetical protein